MVQKVTNPEILARLNSQRVTDPAILAQLNAQEPSGFLDDLGRQAGLTARHAVGGVTKAVTGLSDAVRPYLDVVVPGEMEPLTPKVDPLLDRFFPKPEGATERIVGEASEFVASAAPWLKAGQAIPGAQVLAEMPKTQMFGAATGGGAGQLAEESGVGEGGQMAASLAGATLPSLPGAAIDLARLAARDPKKAQQVIALYRDQGIDPTVGDIGRGGTATFENISRQAPGGGNYERTLNRQNAQIQSRIDQVTGNISPNATTQELGERIQESLIGTDGWLGKSKQASSKLYDDAQELFDPATPTGLDSTMKVFTRNRATDAAPKTTRRLESDFFRSLGDDLAEDIAEFVGDTPLSGALPYETVRGIRSMVGRKIDNSILQPDVPTAQLREVYGALSDDLMNGVKATGNQQAVDAMQIADASWKSRMSRIEQVEKVVDLKGGAEQVYKSLMSGSREGATKLKAVFELLDPGSQDALTGSFVRRLGQANPGAQDAEGTAFSLNTYLTNWNKVSPEAKSVMFRNNPEIAKATGAIAKIAENFKSTMKLNQNTSLTARQLGGMGIGSTVLTSLMFGRPGIAATAAAPVVANIGMSRLMSNKTFVTWLAKNGNTPVEHMPVVLNQLRQMAEKNGDVEAATFVDELSQQGSD